MVRSLVVMEGGVGIGEPVIVGMADGAVRDREEKIAIGPVLVFPSGYLDFEEVVDEMFDGGCERDLPQVPSGAGNADRELRAGQLLMGGVAKGNGFDLTAVAIAVEFDQNLGDAGRSRTAKMAALLSAIASILCLRCSALRARSSFQVTGMVIGRSVVVSDMLSP